MQQLFKIWTGLDLRRQIIVIGATIAMFFAILAMSRMATSPNMTLLYAGLDSAAAGEVVQSLEQSGVAYEVRGSSIFVDTKQRDQLRLTLASQGLPANGSSGYELLDSLSGFGTTSQMFDAAYWRAKEGELARTITSSPHISAARVHIATTGSNPFQRGTTPKASVAITSGNGDVSAQQAKAIRYLVASAVSGLQAEDVVVIDANGTLLGEVEDSVPAIAGDDKALVLKERVQRLLEARVGFGNSVVEVSVDTITESEAIREKSFDPNGRVAISTDTEERNNSSTGGGGGDVTVASNLPDQEGNASGGSSSSKDTEVRERINYEVSETSREIIRAPGAIKRLTVAVLVNNVTVLDEAQQPTQVPRSEEEIAALRELVASAIGFDEARGDKITIKSMQLQSTPVMGTEATGSLIEGINIDLMSAIQMIILAIVTLVLGLFVVRPILSKPAPALPAPSAETPELEELPDINLLSSTDAGAGDMSQDADSMELPPLPDLPSISASGGAGVSDDPAERLRSMIGDRQEETVEILRSWLEDKEENA